MQNLLLIAGAVGPIFVMILIGFALRRVGFPGDGFWPAAERFTYFVLFPALLVHRLALSQLGDYAVGPLAAAIVGLLLAMTALAYALRPWLKVDGPAFSSVYQGLIRFNTFIGLAVALTVFHAEGGTVAALVMAIMIPLINVLCVLVLSVHAGGSATVASVARGLMTNPLILACLTGIGLNQSGIGLPWGSAAVLEILARAALPLGLPLLAALLCALLGAGALETAVLISFAALPGASTAYILARQMGGDAPLIAAIVTVETALALVTLPLVLTGVVAGLAA